MKWRNSSAYHIFFLALFEEYRVCRLLLLNCEDSILYSEHIPSGCEYALIGYEFILLERKQALTIFLQLLEGSKEALEGFLHCLPI